MILQPVVEKKVEGCKGAKFNRTEDDFPESESMELNTQIHPY
jgi:hypothetical protein